MNEGKELRLTVRADGGGELGYGHLQRTGSVIQALRALTALRVRYLVREGCDTAMPEELGADIELVEGERWIESFDPKAGPLLLDSYETREAHLKALRARGVWTALFEDGRRLESYACDLLIDSSPGAPDLGYPAGAGTRLLLGTSYVPLREEFLKVERPEKAGGVARHLLITFGGSDPEDLTARLLPVLDRLHSLERITVVLGPGYQGKVTVADSGGRIVVLRKVRNMAELMAEVDLAASAAGGTALELAYMGVPALLIPLSEDQQPIATALERAGAAQLFTGPEEVDDIRVTTRFERMIKDDVGRASMSAAGRALVDGHGAERIARALFEGWMAGRG